MSLPYQVDLPVEIEAPGILHVAAVGDISERDHDARVKGAPRQRIKPRGNRGFDDLGATGIHG